MFNFPRHLFQTLVVGYKVQLPIVWDKSLLKSLR